MPTLKKSLVVLYYQHTPTVRLFLIVYIGPTFGPVSLIPNPEPL